MTIEQLHRMDYTCNRVEYVGLSSDIPNGVSDLPTEGVNNCSTFFVVDTGVTYMFLRGTWYQLQ